MKGAILYVLDYYLPHQGGVETVFEQIITRSRQSGHQVIVLTSRFDDHLSSRALQEGIEIVRIGRGRLSFMIGALWEGCLLLKSRDISFIHTSTYGGAIPAAILGLLFRKQVLLTVHEIFGKLWWRYKPRYLAWIYLLLEKLIFCFSYSAYHVVSLYTLNALRIVYGIGDEKLYLIYNGVDQDFWNPKLVTIEEKSQISSRFSLDKRWNLLYYGHTGISKGVDYLIEALPELLSRYQDLQLIFNFIPAQRQDFVVQKLEKLLVQCGQEQSSRVKISYGMSKEELRALVACVDGVIAPSLSEGFGSVHTEVGAMQIPLITTRVASIPEVVSGNVIFISPSSSKEIYQGIVRLRREEFDYSEIKTFDWARQYQQIDQLYKLFYS